MRIRVFTFAMGAALLLALAGPSYAAIEKNGVGGAETVECRGQAVQVNGTSQDLTLLGECPDVQVNGMGNTVRIELARKIDVNGMNNKVVWGQGISGAPRVATAGMGNSVRQGAVVAAAQPATSATTSRKGGDSAAVSSGGDTAAVQSGRKASGRSIEVNGDHRTVRVDCGGSDAQIGGNHNEVTLTGECRNVEVSGNHNTVHVDVAAAISAVGNRNSVTWSRGAGVASPRVSNVGTGNTVSRASE